MTLLIKSTGETYDLLDYGVKTRNLIISSPNIINSFSEVENRMGVIDNGMCLGPRSIVAYYRATSKDITDFSLLRDDVFSIFTSKEPFYLIEKRLPGKRWLVRINAPFQIPQKSIFGNFDVDLIGIKGVSESIGTTQDIQQNGGITYDSEMWSYGMGLLHDDESHIYTHTALDFSIYNAGNVAIHPFEQELEIIINNASKNYELKNLTTGDTFKYTGDTQGTLKLDGPNITLNNLQTLRDTNKEFMTLAPGWNHFKQNQNREVSFDFRFYYL